MSETSRHHVGLAKVLDEDRRDLFHELPSEMQDSWRPASEEEGQAAVGEADYQYTVDLDEAWAERFRREAGNAKYVVPVEVAEIPDPEPIVETLDEAEVASFPDNAEWGYHHALGIEDEGYDGEDVVQFNLDTGVAQSHVDTYYKGRTIYRLDYTGQGVEDKNGHGSMSSSIQIARKANAAFLKVLGDDGRGHSDWIIAGFLKAYEYARRHPNIPVQVNASLGGGFSIFPPYRDAVMKLLSLPNAQVVISAGNDGRYGIAAPANSVDGIASIAFGLNDYRADFSNHSEKGGCASIGYRALAINNQLVFVRVNGTSFSAPWRSRITACLATPKMGLGTIQEVNTSILANCRDTPEPLREESAGAIDARAAIAKLKGRSENKEGQRRANSELERLSVSTYRRASIRERRNMGDVVTTVGRRREDFSVVRLLGRFHTAVISDEEIEALEAEEG